MTRKFRNHPASFVLLSVALILIFLAAVPAQTSRRGTQNASSTARTAKPRLVLVIIIDMFRYDFLTRFGDLFVDGGFRRLLREGASWSQTHYDHFPTYTAPGVATVMTGTWPSEHGIIANAWPDAAAGRNVASVFDASVQLLGGAETEEGASPRRLMASTVGDELRLATSGRSKVIGISGKDRAAILPSGGHANAAYWFSQDTGNMVSSTYYFNQLPSWVVSFNKKRPADKYFGARWERLLPAPEYEKRAGLDAPPWENIGKVPGDSNAFPHIVTGGANAPGRAFYSALDYSPFSNDLLISFAQAAIVNETLGEDDDTDILSICLSANDYIGHRFGPYSHEVMDITLWTDRQIEGLLDFVNARVGLQNTVVVFTADHGVAPVPEHANALGLPGGRVVVNDVLNAVKDAIKAHYNPNNTSPDPTANYVSGFINSNIYFNHAMLKRDGVDQQEIERVAGMAALTVPGIRRCFTRSQLERGAISPADPLARRVLHGFYSGRSGDVVVIAEPFKYMASYSIAATHGSPYSYDTHVPMIIRGALIRAGHYLESASPADIAPTLSEILDLQPPSNSTGRVLREALAR